MSPRYPSSGTYQTRVHLGSFHWLMMYLGWTDRKMNARHIYWQLISIHPQKNQSPELHVEATGDPSLNLKNLSTGILGGVGNVPTYLPNIYVALVLAVSKCKTKIGQTKTAFNLNKTKTFWHLNMEVLRNWWFVELLGGEPGRSFYIMIVSWVTITMWCYSETAPECFGLLVQKGPDKRIYTPWKLT